MTYRAGTAHDDAAAVARHRQMQGDPQIVRAPAARAGEGRFQRIAIRSQHQREVAGEEIGAAPAVIAAQHHQLAERRSVLQPVQLAGIG